MNIMVTQVENKIKELKALKRKEYYKQKDTDLRNWGIAKDGKGKKATPIVITDEEYENLIKLASGVGKTGRNGISILLNKASGLTAVICGLIAIFSLISGGNINFVAFSVAGVGFALTFKGLGEAIRLLQQILDGGRGVVPEAEPEAPAAPAFVAAPNGFVPVQPAVYQVPYPQQPYYTPAPAPQPAPVAPPIVTSPADTAKPTDYSTMPDFNFNPNEDFFAKGYEPKPTFGEQK